MKNDITNRNDIELLVNTFYNKIKTSAGLNYFFTNVSWDKHLNTMYGFWENIILQTGSYTGNPMNIHEKISKRAELKTSNFKEWVDLFIQTVDELFTGENAELAKKRAVGIANIIKEKIT